MDEFERMADTEWHDFFERFNKEHQGWLIRLWVVDTSDLEAGIADDETAEWLDHELTRVTLEQRDNRTALEVVAVHDDSKIHHSIEEPVSISVEHDTDGEMNGLRIDADNGTTTLMRFRSPSAP